MPSIDNNTVLQQNELQEMLGHPPNWILRSGIGLICIIILAALSLSWVIRYPDEISARITLLQETPPHELRPLLSARLDTVLRTNGEVVNAGDRIVLLESAASWQDIDSLRQLLQTGFQGLEICCPKLQLGSIQGTYAAFQEARNNLQFFLGRDIFKVRAREGQQEISTLYTLDSVYESRKAYFIQEKQLIHKDLNRSKKLHQEGVVSEVEHEGQQIQLLRYEQQLKDLDVAYLQNRLRIQQLKTQLAESDDEYLRQKNDLELRLEKASQELRSAVESWYAQYIISSPIDGKIEWHVQLTSQYLVQAGSLLGVIVTENKQSQIIGELHLPASGMGKIRAGAPVKINLDAYPEQEFGQIAAQVGEINLVPTKTQDGQLQYTIKVYLSDTLSTTYGKQLTFQPNMPGTATIITEDQRIIERIFKQLLSILKNN